MKNICLNMIVRNCATTIEKTLESVAGVVDYYVIVDTGSEDGTIETIKNKMKELGIEGELHERVWKGFGPSRDEAFRLALGKAKYILFIDSDEEMKYTSDEIFKDLTEDFYELYVCDGICRWERQLLVRADSENSQLFMWKNDVHNVFTHTTGDYKHGGVLEGVSIQSFRTKTGKSYGITSYDKFMKDARTLRTKLVETNDTRSCFYLAQSYRDAGEPELALKYYLHRADMGGTYVGEIYCAMVEAANLLASLRYPYDEYQSLLLDAFNKKPDRGEALYWLARNARIQGNYAQAHMYSKHASKIKEPPSGVFINLAIHRFLIFDELSISSYYLDEKEDCLSATTRVMEFLIDEERRSMIKILPEVEARLLDNARLNIKKFLSVDVGTKSSANQILNTLKVANEKEA